MNGRTWDNWANYDSNIANISYSLLGGFARVWRIKMMLSYCVTKVDSKYDTVTHDIDESILCHFLIKIF